jgi:hypothetical protein
MWLDRLVPAITEIISKQHLLPVNGRSRGVFSQQIFSWPPSLLPSIKTSTALAPFLA